MTQPWLSCYTPTFRLANGLMARPGALGRCVQSVTAQAEQVQHVIVEDATPGGSGVGGMYTQVPEHADRVHGEYVHVLADDDELMSPTVVSQVRAFARVQGYPPVILVNAWKCMEQGWMRLPVDWAGVPVLGQVDLGCIITRRDVWLQHVQDYGDIYEGDFRYLAAVHAAGHTIARLDLDFVRGAVMRGRPE